MKFFTFPTRTAENTYIIENESDFPTQDATTITLNTGCYEINAAIVTAKRFVIPDGSSPVFKGVSTFVSFITYTGTGDMFTGTNFTNISFNFMTMSCPSALSTWNVTNAVRTAGVIVSDDVIYVDMPDLGIVEKIVSFRGSALFMFDIGQGLAFDGVRSVSLITIALSEWKNEVATMLTFDGAMDFIGIVDVGTLPDSNEFLFDFKSTLVLGRAVITSLTFDDSLSGTIFAAGSKDETDVNFTYAANSGLPKSIAFGNMNISSTETVTISSTGVPVVVNDATTGGTNIWTEVGATSRFTFGTTTGRFTYTGLSDANIEIISSSTIEKSGGGADTISTLIAKNGTALAESKSASQNNTPTSVVSLADVLVSTGDYIELMVQNDSTTVDIDVNISNFIIKD